MSELPVELSGISIERLRTFCRITQAGSIAAAAEGDPNRQSLYSRQVKELEECFGAKLLLRVGRSLQLTEIGKRLALLTQTYFQALNEVRDSTGPNLVRVGAGDAVFRWLLLPRLHEIQGGTPPLTLEIATHRTEKAVDCVKNGTLDLAIVRKDAAKAPLRTAACGEMTYTLVVPRRLLPEKSAAGLRLLGVLPFGMITGDGVFTKGIEDIAAKAEVRLDIQLRAENFGLLAAAMEHADIAAVLPTVAATKLSAERYAIVEMPELAELRSELCIVFELAAAELRAPIRTAVSRLAKTLGTDRL
jgi:DNA-binding transcriptional LysR family regulator